MLSQMKSRLSNRQVTWSDCYQKSQVKVKKVMIGKKKIEMWQNSFLFKLLISANDGDGSQPLKIF